MMARTTGVSWEVYSTVVFFRLHDEPRHNMGSSPDPSKVTPKNQPFPYENNL